MKNKIEKIEKHLNLPKQLLEDIEKKYPYLDLTTVIIVALSKYLKD